MSIPSAANDASRSSVLGGRETFSSTCKTRNIASENAWSPLTCLHGFPGRAFSLPAWCSARQLLSQEAAETFLLSTPSTTEWGSHVCCDSCQKFAFPCWWVDSHNDQRLPTWAFQREAGHSKATFLTLALTCHIHWLRVLVLLPRH